MIMRGKYDSGAFSEEDVLSQLRQLFPRETQDKFQLASIILFILLPLGFLFEIFIVLPDSYPILSQDWTLRVSLLSLLGLSAYLNVYKLITVGPNGSKSGLPAVVTPGFKYCHDCQLNVPPRSFHCPVCNKCILRRDHHCSFVALCVGHFNQRYFLVAVLHLWLIAATTCSWNWTWMWQSLGGFSLARLWILIIPHFAWAFRFLSFIHFCHVLVFVLSSTTLFFLTYLVGGQAFCIYRGQTRVEYLQDIQAYNLGVYGNFQQILGRRWPLALICPFFSSPLDSDGYTFHVRETVSIRDNLKAL